MLETQAMSSFFHDPSAPVQPDQLAGEFGELLEIYCARRPRRVLEIGVREGGTLYQWIKHAGRGTTITAVEIGMAGDWGNRTMPDPIGWTEWAEARGAALVPIIGDSHEPEVISQIEGQAPFDFAFIDGDHSLFGVTCDFLVCSRLMREGGVIALHDILRNPGDERIEIWRYWPVIKALHRTRELLSGPGQQTRGIGVVYV